VLMNGIGRKTMSVDKKILCDTCVYKFYCEDVRIRKCKNRIEGTPKPKEYDLTLAAQGYYKK